MKSIYVVSTKKRAAKNMYKVGFWSGTLRSLESRYTTSLLYPMFYYFSPKQNAEEIETLFLNRADNYRFVSRHG